MTHLEEKLNLLKREMTTMFVLVHSQLNKTKKAVVDFDKDIAHEVVSYEKRVNAQELKIDRDCENIFALYQPVAVDLRYVLALLKINTNLERTGDIAEGIAKFIIQAEKPMDKRLIEETQLVKMFDEALLMTEDIENAFAAEDTTMARSIFKQDEGLDAINKTAHKKIATYIKDHPENIEEALHALSTIRKLERVGDQAKNIAEEIIFYIEAKVLKHSRKLGNGNPQNQ